MRSTFWLVLAAALIALIAFFSFVVLESDPASSFGLRQPSFVLPSEQDEPSGFPASDGASSLPAVTTPAETADDRGLSLQPTSSSRAPSTQALVTTSTTLPPTTRPPPKAAIVVARTAVDDLKWLTAFTVPFVAYTEPALMSTGSNIKVVPAEDPPFFAQVGTSMVKPASYRGATTRECGGYLAYIVENYHHLADVNIFMQGQPLKPAKNKFQHADYHTDRLYVKTIRSIAAQPQRVGFCSFNIQRMDWRRKEGEDVAWYVASMRRNLQEEYVKSPTRYAVLNRTLLPLLNDSGVQCFCCAQFAVSAARIRQHPVVFWEQLLDFIRDEVPNSAQGPRSNVRCSLMERLWHVIFGEASICPKDTSCRITYEGKGSYHQVKDTKG